MTIVPVSDIQSDCAPSVMHDTVKAWREASGTNLFVPGIVTVHADSDDPLIGPVLSPEDRLQNEQWVRAAFARTSRGRGLGEAGYAPGSHGVLRHLVDLPQEFLRQRDVMQCLRGPGDFSTRFSHGNGTALAGGLMAAKAGCSRQLVQLAFASGLLHDVGHRSFGHPGETAIEQHLNKYQADPRDRSHYNHADQSGVDILEIFGSAEEVQDLAYAVGGHSWTYLRGRPSAFSAGLARDFAGAADRTDYSITDPLKDCLLAKRIAWAEVPELFPQLFELAKMSDADVRNVMSLGSREGGRVLRNVAMEVFTSEFARVLRDTGVVGLHIDAAQALSELRLTGNTRLFGASVTGSVATVSPQILWEDKVVATSRAVMNVLEREAEQAGFGDNALDESIRKFGLLTETQVIAFVKERDIDVGFDIDDLNRVPKIDFGQQREPVRRTNPMPRKDLLPLGELLGSIPNVVTTSGTRVTLQADEAMTYLGHLSNPRREAFEMTARSVDGQPKLPVPSDEASQKVIGESVEFQLEQVLRQALDAAPCQSNPTPLQSRRARSLEKLARIAEDLGGRPAATLRAYSEVQHAGRQLAASQTIAAKGAAPAAWQRSMSSSPVLGL